MNNNTIILGIDHGYGNIKSAHTCFPTGVTTYEKEPTFHNDLLIYDGHFYTIGEGHKEFTADKMMDGDYYVLFTESKENQCTKYPRKCISLFAACS